ncbi:MAG: RNA polymerase sporulation sigma factor SigE [Clostridia bacterium]
MEHFTPEKVHYLGSGEVLPPALCREEEELLLEKIDTKKSKDALVEHNLRLVVYIAKKFENTNICMEDLISIGTIGLIKAVNTFKPDKKIKLATYASRCIENEILMYLRKYNARKSEISFDEPLNVDWDGNELLLSDVLGTENDSVESALQEAAELQLLQGAMMRLGKREREIINLRYGLNGKREKTQKEVADMLGISQSYISRLEKKIMGQLKKDIVKNI